MAAQHEDRSGRRDFPQHRERLLQMIADAVPVLAWVCGYDRRYGYFNRQWNHFTGTQPVRTEGAAWTEVLHPDDRDGFEAAFEAAFDAHVPFRRECRLRRHDGVYRWMCCEGSPQFGEDEQFEGFVGTFVDITEQKQVSEELGRIGTALAYVSDAIALADLQGRSIYHNQAFQELFAYTTDELNTCGGQQHLFVDSTVAREVLARLRRGASWSGEAEFYSRSERVVPAFLRAHPIRDGSGAVVGFIATFTDITGHRLTEEVMRETAAWFRATFDQAAVGVAEVELDGRWRQVNRKLCEVLGYTEAELLEHRVQDVIAPEEVQAEAHMIADFMSGKISTCTREKQFLRKDGSRVWINAADSVVQDAAGRPAYYIAIIEDITERKKMHDALLKSEERYRSFVSMISESIWCYELDEPLPTELDVEAQVQHFYAHARLVECNAVYAHEVAGDDAVPHDLIGRLACELFEMIPERHQFYADFMRQGHRLQGQRYSDLDATGHRRRYMANVVGIIQEGQVVRVWASRTDVTEAVEIQHRMLIALEEQQQRIGQDLHDGIGQLLTAVRLLSDQLADALGGQDEEMAALAGKIAHFAQDALQQTRRVHRGLTSVQLLEQGLVPALHGLADSINQLPDVTCTFEHDGQGEVRDTGTGIHLYRIAQEAIHNALKHGQPKNVHVTLQTDNENIVLTVRDDGTGFDPQQVRRDGLGLSGMHYRALMIGGSLDVESSPDGGTRLTCTIPLETSERRIRTLS